MYGVFFVPWINYLLLEYRNSRSTILFTVFIIMFIILTLSNQKGVGFK